MVVPLNYASEQGLKYSLESTCEQTKVDGGFSKCSNTPMAKKSDKMLFFEDFLKSKQLRRSRQRTIIAQEFFDSDKHLAVEELLQRSRKQDKNVGFATVYRTLKLLVECGLAHERDFNTGRKLYEQSERGENHSHLVCYQCGHVEEFLSPDIARLQEKMAREHRFRMQSYRHELYGVCEQYAKKGRCKHLEKRENK